MVVPVMMEDEQELPPVASPANYRGVNRASRDRGVNRASRYRGVFRLRFALPFGRVFWIWIVEGAALVVISCWPPSACKCQTRRSSPSPSAAPLSRPLPQRRGFRFYWSSGWDGIGPLFHPLA